MTSLLRKELFAMMLAVGFLTLSVHAQADDWILYSGKNTGIGYYYDGRSVKSMNAGVYQLFSREMDHSSQGTSAAGQSTLLLQVDCRSHTTGTLGVLKNGMMSRVRPGVDMGQPGIPEAASRSLLKRICK
jgi:hypothetical protein